MSELLGFLLGILSAWIAASIPTSSAWFTQLKDFLSRSFSSTPKIKEFERRLRSYSFEKFPHGTPFSYYVRRHAKNKKEDRDKKRDPIYYFFIEQAVTIENFMAFLIPPLDRGHGRRGAALDETIADEWKHYLHAIDQRTPKTPTASGEPRARRIVFFDKSKLLLFIFFKEWVISAAQIEGKKYKPLGGSR